MMARQEVERRGHLRFVIVNTQALEIASPDDVCNATREVDKFFVTSTCAYCACLNVTKEEFYCEALCVLGVVSSNCRGTEETVISYQRRMYDTNCTCTYSFCGLPDVINVQVEGGKSAFLNCPAKPYWNFNSNAIYLKKEKYTTKNSTLEIHDMTHSDSGIYSCGTEKIFSLTVVKQRTEHLEVNAKSFSVTNIVIFSIFGCVFVAILLTATKIMRIKYRRNKRKKEERSKNGVYTEIDEHFLTEVENIYNQVDKEGQKDEISPRNIHAYEYPDLNESFGYTKPKKVCKITNLVPRAFFLVDEVDSGEKALQQASHMISSNL